MQGCAWGFPIISILIFALQACRVALRGWHKLWLILYMVWSWVPVRVHCRGAARLDFAVEIYAERRSDNKDQAGTAIGRLSPLAGEQ
jgi:hypothetical protein